MAELQQFFAVWVNNLADVIPLGYAFGAGMVSAVNPCGFAMLPAYLGLFLGGGETVSGSLRENTRSALVTTVMPAHVGRAILVSAAVTAGFVLLFGAVGIVVSAGGQLIVVLVPWLALAIGAVLVALGVAMLSGFHFSAPFAVRLAKRLGDPRTVSTKGFFVFGIAYAVASLSCTLPVFLIVVGGTLTSGGFAGAMLQFISYALGMGLIVLALTLSIAAFQGALVSRVQRIVPYVERVSAFLLIIAGSYIVFYWLSNGGLI